MALPPRLWIPDGGHDLPPGSAPPGSSMAVAGPRPPASGSTPAQRLRRRALWRGEAGLPDRPVLVEWFPIAEHEHERDAARRLRGLCHVHLLRLLDIGTADARSAYAVSEAPDGVDLFTVLRAAPGELPPFWGVAVLAAVARALTATGGHLAHGKRRHGGHGRVNLGTIFVGWDGSVRLLAYSPLGTTGAGGSGRFDDNVAPELRLSERLLTSAADVYALGSLLRELLPPAALRRRNVARLIRRCLHVQADQRIALSTLGDAFEELLLELRAPAGRAQAIGEVLGRYCPRATTDLIDADWGEHTGDGYPALPPTLAPLSASTVMLSPTWLRPLPPKKPPPVGRLRQLVIPTVLGLSSLAALWALSPPAAPLLPAASAARVDPPPIATIPDEAATPLGLAGLRVSIERIDSQPDRITLLARLVNPSRQPIATQLDGLLLDLDGAPGQPPQAALRPAPSPPITVGAGRVQEVQLHFPIAPLPDRSPRKLSRKDVRLRSLPLRDSASVTK